MASSPERERTRCAEGGGFERGGKWFPRGIENSWEGEEKEPLKKREGPVGV